MSVSSGLRARVERALADVSLPAAVVLTDAVDANLDHLAARTGSVSLRLATKSVRCQGLLRRAAEALGDRCAGLMTVSPRESLALAEHGWRDLLVAYPVARPADARPLLELARRGVVARQVVDHPDHVRLLARLAADAGVALPVVIEVDASTRPFLGVHLGVRRSPLRDPADVLALHALIDAEPALRFAGLQMYEAQIAGVADRSGGVTGPIRRAAKAISRPDVRRRRAAHVRALLDAGVPVPLVNGGGTGSAAWTAEDPTVTEVTIGSGLLAPHLFDDYDDLDLQPAAFAALPVTRRPAPDRVTVHGGGYPASGAIGADRSPRVAAPASLAATPLEGFGEVQTPLVGPGVGELSLGDVVLLRHAKAGELLDRFGRVNLLHPDGRVEVVPTWRGEGIDLG